MSIDRINDDAPEIPQRTGNSLPSLIDLGYPLRVTPKGSTSDYGTTLTATEFWALQNAWGYIKSYWQRYSLELYLDYYTENHRHINRFRNKKTGKICVLILSEHSKMIFGIFREVVENGIKSWEKSKNRISDMAISHVAHGISCNDLIVMVAAFKNLILQKCDGISTPTVESALDKLFQEVFTQQLARETSGSDDDSLDE